VRARDLALSPQPKGGPAEPSLEDAERLVIEKALARHAGDVRAAAAQLGLSRSALYRRLQAYGIRAQQ
jgi:DNA-binding NtrC family response regulator